MVTAGPSIRTVLQPPAAGSDPGGLGQAFVEAIVDGDFDRLQTFFAPDVRFRALIPRETSEASTAAGARAHIEDWFGDTDQRVLLGSAIELVGDRLVVGYSLEFAQDGKRRIVHQSLAATVQEGRFRDVSLVCSGFRPLAATTASSVTGSDGRPCPALGPITVLDATGLSCATLTPTIRAAVVALDPGAVLEIVTDDPDAAEGLRSWTRLTGHELIDPETEADVEAGSEATRRFHIRRSPQGAAPTQEQGAK